MAKKKYPVIGFCPTGELDQRIRELAMREDRSVSQIVKRCVEAGIERVEKGFTHAVANAE